MIKVGIYGPAEVNSPLRKQLLRLLLRHPDVDLRSVAAPGANGIPLTQLHPVYTGETDLRLLPDPQLDGIDVMFVIDEENLSCDIINLVDANPEFRLIVLGNAPGLRYKPLDGMIYGFAEFNRKALVRGARMAVSPSPIALLIETALFPLAKNWMLADVEINGSVTSVSPIGENIAEAVRLIQSIQTDFNGRIELSPEVVSPYERVDLRLSLDCTNNIDQIISAYNNAYEDHGFSYVVQGNNGFDEDLRGSNKCLIQLFKKDGKLHINACADFLTRSNAGNAVHLMNLLFGLQERTGLSI